MAGTCWNGRASDDEALADRNSDYEQYPLAVRRRDCRVPSRPARYRSTWTLGATTTSGLYGDGPYFDGADNVRAVLVDNVTGNFVFDTNDNARLDLHRRLVLDFHSQDRLPSSPIPASGPYAVDVFIGTIGVTGVAADDGDLRAMTAGETLYRRARFGWVAGSKTYSLRWDNVENNGDGLLSFHCDLGDPCQQWTMTPDGQAGLYAITSGKKPTETRVGSYNMPFSATLTAQ